MRFLYVLKIYHVKLFIVEKMGFGTAPRRCALAIIAENLIVENARMCLHMHALARVRKPRLTYVGQRPFWLFNFPKIDFCSFKRLYFPF